MAAGSSNVVDVSFTNAGTLVWAASPPNHVRLSYHWRNGACLGNGFAVWNGARTSLPQDVDPGETVHALAATVQAPSAPGMYCLQYDLIHEGVTWFSWQGVPGLYVTVTVT
jgi:hypothetical protein